MPCLERDHSASQHGEVAGDVEVSDACAVFFKQGVAHPMVTDLASSPVPAHKLREALRSLLHEAAHVVADAAHALFARSAARARDLLGDDNKAAHMRQSAGDGFDGIYLDPAPLYASVPAIFCFAGKRGEALAAMRCASQ